MMDSMAKLLMVMGVLLVLMGGGLLLVGSIPWVGRLPGDLLIQRKNFTVYLPLTTSLILSFVGTIILWLLTRR